MVYGAVLEQEQVVPELIISPAEVSAVVEIAQNEGVSDSNVMDLLNPYSGTDGVPAQSIVLQGLPASRLNTVIRETAEGNVCSVGREPIEVSDQLRDTARFVLGETFETSTANYTAAEADITLDREENYIVIPCATDRLIIGGVQRLRSLGGLFRRNQYGAKRSATPESVQAA